jgi:nitrite reductase/ring-hydroxylating ferredoxin subunit
MTDVSRIKLCPLSAVPEGEPLRIKVQGADAIAVCKLGDAYFAIADTCTHGMASLSEGEIMDGKIYCPFHAGSFDIRTGEPIDPPCSIPLKTFRVFENEGHLFLDGENALAG